MKQENGIYILAFLCGVVAVNLLGNAAWANNSILNRYSLAALSFDGIVYGEYFIQILFLRFRTVAGLWILARLIPKKIVTVGFALVISVALGGVAAMAILANGIWGILFYLCTLIPHIVCYGVAFVLWRNKKIEYSMTGRKTEQYLTLILILILVGIGCILEAYISPILVKNIIKY